MADEGLAASLAATAQNGLPWDIFRGRKVWAPPTQPMPTGPVDPNAGLAEALSRSSLLPPQPPAGTVQLNAPLGQVTTSPVVASSPTMGNFTEEDIDKMIGAVQGASGGGLATKIVKAAAPAAAQTLANKVVQPGNLAQQLGMTVQGAASEVPAMTKEQAARAAKAELPTRTPPEQFTLTARGPTSPVPDFVQYNFAGKLPKKGGVGLTNMPNPYVQTVRDPIRMMYPGIYRDPREIAEAANRQIAPENPMMKQLFGVTREDLQDIGRGRVGWDVPNVNQLAGGQGARIADQVTTPQNTQRLIDILTEAGKYPGLRAMDAWYVMDPAFQRLEKMVGTQAAIPMYKKWNTMTGAASASSEVLDELQRGGAAHWLSNQGRWDDFVKYGGLAKDKRTMADFPEDMRYMAGHLAHKTSHADPMESYLRSGIHESDRPKIVPYVLASGVPQTGFQTRFPVGDAHFSRILGLADLREGRTTANASWSRPEYNSLTPWFRENVARQVGLEAVPGQARLWGAGAPQTGVTSPIGAPKLELLTQQILVAAKRLGLSPEKARDMILKGEIGAGAVAGTAGLGTALGASIDSRPGGPQQDQRS